MYVVSSSGDEDGVVSGSTTVVSGSTTDEDEVVLDLELNFPSAYSTISVITIDTTINITMYPVYPPPDDTGGLVDIIIGC